MIIPRLWACTYHYIIWSNFEFNGNTMNTHCSRCNYVTVQGRRTVFDSQGTFHWTFLNNHLFLRMKNSLIIKITFFHYKELFVEWTMHHGSQPRTFMLSVYLIKYHGINYHLIHHITWYHHSILCRSLYIYIIDYVILVFVLNAQIILISNNYNQCKFWWIVALNIEILNRPKSDQSGMPMVKTCLC